MALEVLMDQVVKGGKTWFEVALGRNANGLTVYVRTDPAVEAFMKNLGNGKTDNVTAYSDTWASLDGSALLSYRVEKNFSPEGKFTLLNVGEPLRIGDTKTGKVNISFLRLVGIGSPSGVQFGITGPVSRQYVSDLKSSLVLSVKELIREYIAPIHIVLRVTSQEV
jgi:hypothetical protein